MKRRSPDAGRRRVRRARHDCEGGVPGNGPLSTAGLLAMAVRVVGAQMDTSSVPLIRPSATFSLREKAGQNDCLPRGEAKGRHRQLCAPLGPLPRGEGAGRRVRG